MTRSPQRSSSRRIALWLLILGMIAGLGWFGARYFKPTPPNLGPFPDLAEKMPWPKPVEAAPSQPAPPAGLQARIKALGAGFDGKVGIAVQSVEQGWTASHFGAGLFPQQSMSKLWVAANMLDQVDKAKVRLSDTVTIKVEDLSIFHQPIAKKVKPFGYTAAVQELAFLAMTQSDNTANEVLYRSTGGQQAIERFFVDKGLAEVAIGPPDRILQTQAAGLSWDPRFSHDRNFWIVREALLPRWRWNAITDYVANPPDAASPIGYATGLSKLQRGELLSPSSTAMLLDLMAKSTTGPDRLRGGLSPGWSMAHKTGTGQVMGTYATAYNDAGILTGPDGRHYSVVVMIGATRRAVPERQALMQAVTRAVISCSNGRC